MDIVNCKCVLSGYIIRNLNFNNLSLCQLKNKANFGAIPCLALGA